VSTTAVLKVSLARSRERPPAPMALDACGARVVLGAEDRFAGSITPSSHRLFGPRGAAVTADGALWIADTGHHRLLGWPALPEQDNAPAEWLIGQPRFGVEGRNAKGDVHGASLNVPTGVCACGEGLAVADAWNHRVLIWSRAPRTSHEPADVVLGQADPHGHQINRGQDRPRADTLYWPYGVFWDGARLWVADTGNRRVLRFTGLPQRHGEAADLVLGQPDFEHRDENAGGVGAATLRWPHAIARWQGRLCVADAGNNRVLMWLKDPSVSMTSSDATLGQRDALALDHNRGEYWPSARAFNMPYGLAVHDDRLYVADTANSRLLRFDSPLVDEAQALAGQPGFADKGDNRWQAAARDSLCWPYAVAFAGDTAVIIDSGNNRVLLWDVA
jgi:sugar lactone lactonase YvrE